MKRKNVLFAVGLISVLVLPVLVSAVTVENPINYNNFSDLIIKGIVPVVSTVIGGVATIMVLWAAILFLTSAGDPNRLGKAKTALMWAIIGIAVALAASGIVALIKKIIGTT